MLLRSPKPKSSDKTGLECEAFLEELANLIAGHRFTKGFQYHVDPFD